MERKKQEVNYNLKLKKVNADDNDIKYA